MEHCSREEVKAMAQDKCAKPLDCKNRAEEIYQS
jgi:hypothetical protein